MDDSRLNRELARVVNRLIDRFLPELHRPYNSRSKIGLWASAFAGTLSWGFAAYGFSLSALDHPVFGFFEVSGSSFGDFEDDQNISILPVFILAVCVLFLVLIMKSFDRGRPLTFFFWGVLFPSLAITIVGEAFSWLTDTANEKAKE